MCFFLGERKLMWYNLGSIMIISNSSKGTVGSRDMVVEGSMIRDLTRDIVRDMGTKDGSILIIIIASIIIVRDGIGIGRRVRIVIDLLIYDFMRLGYGIGVHVQTQCRERKD